MAEVSWKKRFLKNSLSSYVSTAVSLGLGLFMFRMLFSTWSKEEFGFWALLWSLFGMGFVLDFGIGMSVQKAVAEKMADDDVKGMNRLLTTAFWGFTVLAAFLFCVLFLLRPVFFHFFVAPPEYIGEFKDAYVYFALCLALIFPLGLFNEMLQGLQRLDLANWVVDPSNPSTARTFVNRLWKLFFATGLASNVDDLGSQGQWPTHPELLDWLAVEFVDSGWDVKHMVELIVTSEAYARSSKTTPALRERDPSNALIAHQSRFRLDAEMIRDNALSLSGLLVEKIGGGSVKPYQPAGYWEHLNFPGRTWSADAGDNQYRRALYTHWQRSFLHPAMLAFDAPSREECTAERPRSNTPLQALVLLNDPTFVEAARAFAERIVEEGGADPAARITWAYREALSRQPSASEAKLLGDLHASQFARYTGDAAAAAALMSVGLHKAAADTPAPELASWTAVARTILNLHETITRP